MVVVEEVVEEEQDVILSNRRCHEFQNIKDTSNYKK